MKAITKVPFYDNELFVVEKDDQKFVAMKPIVEALGLDWRSQYQKISSSQRYGDITIPFETVGGKQDMIFLPLNKLNGWLFSINAEKCRSDIRQKVIRYQEECFQVLYDYFHQGGAINPNANATQLSGLVDQIVEHTTKAVDETLINRVAKLSVELAMKDVELNDEKRQNHLLMNFAPKGVPGEISGITGRPKNRYVGGYFTSNRSGHPIEDLVMQPEFNF